jgi:soluble cytochrome b562
MESVNPKTGEVTVPKKPIRRAEEPTGTTVMDAEPEIVDEKSIKKTKSRQLTKEEIEDYSEQLGDTETWLSEGTVEEAEKALKRMKDQEAYYYGQYKMGKLDPAPGEQTEARMKFLQKKLEEAEMTKDRRLITPNEVEELMSLEKTFSQSSEQVLENEMNRVLNQYDKSMFIKDAEGRVDVSNPANAEKMAMLLKKDHPEIYNKIYNLGEDLGQKQMLDEFDITGRKPNAKGGIAGLL